MSSSTFSALIAILWFSVIGVTIVLCGMWLWITIRRYWNDRTDKKTPPLTLSALCIMIAAYAIIVFYYIATTIDKFEWQI